MIFLDNASTTRPKFFAKDYSNLWLNSNTGYAKNEQEALAECRKRIEDCLGVKSGYVLFCRCATDAISWLVSKFVTDEVYCSPFEHDSVTNVSEIIDYVKPPEKFFLQEYTFYTHQLVNQVTGKVYDVKEISKHIDRANNYFGVDATAAIGHVKLPKNLDTYCDAIWASSHKWHGPKNQGFIWLSDRLFGYLGGNNNPRNSYSLLHGTLDVPGICAMTNALCWTIDSTYDALNLYHELTNYLFNYASFKGLPMTERITDGSLAIHAITIPNVNADALQVYLASKDIYVGVGHSACSEDSDYRVLDAFGYTKEQAEQIIRVSFCEDNTLKDIEELVDNIIEFKGKF